MSSFLFPFTNFQLMKEYIIGLSLLVLSTRDHPKELLLKWVICMRILTKQRLHIIVTRPTVTFRMKALTKRRKGR